MVSVDTSCFTWRDAYDIALQRTNTLIRIPKVGSPAYRAWTSHFNLPLTVEAFLRKRAIVSQVVVELEQEFNVIAENIDFPIESLMDIGCGHGIIDLFFHRAFKCRLHLVDIEHTEEQYHHFSDSGAGYGSLTRARDFLVANKVPREHVRTTNPRSEPLVDEGLSVIISLLSCGFHYPVFEYADFAKRSLRSGGFFIVDLRDDSGQDRIFEIFPQYFVISRREKSRRIAFVAT